MKRASEWLWKVVKQEAFNINFQNCAIRHDNLHVGVESGLETWIIGKNAMPLYYQGGIGLHKLLMCYSYNDHTDRNSTILTT